jgi:uracil-DNA glycosylase
MKDVSIEIGQCTDLWDLPDVLTEEEFNNKIRTFKDQTAVRYYKRANILIMKSLLTSAQDGIDLPESPDECIVGGSVGFEARIFVLKNNRKATLLWKGPVSQYRPSYMKLRDNLVGPRKHQLYGRAKNIHENCSYAPKERSLQERKPRGKIQGMGLGDNEMEISEYNALVVAIKNCPGGCLRMPMSSNPMLRPEGGYRIPSDMMLVLEQPNGRDDRENGCLTIGPEDYVRGRPDPTATVLLEFFDILEISHRDIFTTNSLLCFQPRKAEWKDAWLPCLSHGWLRQMIQLCSPKLVITMGAMALNSVLYAIGHKPLQDSLKNIVNHTMRINEGYIYPLYHVSPTKAQINRPLEMQREDWRKLKSFKDIMLESLGDTLKGILHAET